MKKIDYKSFSENSQPKEGEQFNRRWWRASKEERPQAIAAVVKLLSEYDSKRQTQYQISARLYGNNALIGMNGLSQSKMAAVQSPTRDRISYNVVSSVIDTICAKLAKNKPKPMFLTSGGDWKMQRKAKKLEKFVDGVFYENNLNELRREIRRDACVFGDGFVHVFEQYDRIKYERVLPGELLVDWMESFYGGPRQLHRVKNIDREVLIELFPKKAAAIKSAKGAKTETQASQQNVSDQVTVVESWHLASGPDAGDGLHVIGIEEDELFSEEWKKPFFPFGRLPYAKNIFGYWAMGAAQRMQNIQLEINKLLWVVQRSMHLMGTFKVWLKNGSKVVKEHLNNDIGAIITGDEPPQYLAPPIVQPEIYSHLNTLKQSAYEQEGISQLSASSQKPAGLNSGKALREMNDIESDRQLVLGQSDEEFALQLGILTIATAKDIFSRNKKLSVKVPGKKFIQEIDWKDVDMDEDEYIMKIFPVSSLPNDPAGRLQTIQEYVQAGLISPRTGRKLLDFPDLEQIEDLQNSTEDYLHMILEKIVDDGDYTPPEPQDDLQLAQELALEYYAQGKLGNLEEEKLELLRRFMDQVALLGQKAQPAQAGAPGAPQATPMPTPQSELVPNMQGAA